MPFFFNSGLICSEGNFRHNHQTHFEYIHLSIKMCTNTTVYHLHQHPKNILLFMPHWTSDSINKQIIFKTIVCVMMIQNFQLQGKCFVVSLLFLCVSQEENMINKQGLNNVQRLQTHSNYWLIIIIICAISWWFSPGP